MRNRNRFNRLVDFLCWINVGFHKAEFGRAWGENYERNFGFGPDHSLLGKDNFPNANGAIGKIIKIELPTIIVEDKDNAEKVILIDSNTNIEKMTAQITMNDLKVDDFVVVIGAPNTQGQVEAKFIRVMPVGMPAPQTPDADKLKYMKNILTKIKVYVLAHKIISAIILVVIIGGGYWGYKKITAPVGATRYVTSKVTSGTIIASITDSGQVSAFNQINVTPQVSGTITGVNVKPGDNVRAGETLFVIDDTSAQQAVRDAEISVQNANLALQKLQLQDSANNLNSALTQAYDNGFTSVSNTFLDLPSITNGINNMFFESTNGTTQQNIDWYAEQVTSTETAQAMLYKQNFLDAYNLATTAYTQNSSDYKTITRTSDNTTIDGLISETYTTTKLIADEIQAANNYIDFVDSTLQKYNFKVPTIITTQEASLSTYTSEINSHLSDLLSAETSISNDKQASPSSDLDVQSAQIAIQQANNTLLDAKQTLADCYVTAPFAGVMASVPVIVGDTAGSGTTLGTIITSKDLATVTLSEVDVAKIALGDKATLTFDAIPNLTIAGQVVEIDSVGTVSQGVVNYNVQVSFDATNDGGVKPGMSVNADIITAIKQNTLMVPNSAIKTQGGVSYVQTFAAPLATPLAGAQGSPSATPPKSQIVVTGISNDTSTEIVSGLNAGDIVVTKTTTATTGKTATTTAPSILGGVGGGGRVGGGAVRIGG